MPSSPFMLSPGSAAAPAGDGAAHWRRARIAACVLLNLAAGVCLLPGLFLPLLTVRIHLGDVELFSTTRSTLGTIQFLHDEGAQLASALILVFSVFVPIVKFVLLLFIALWPSNYWRWHLHAFVVNWSKFAMVDVFVTATFVAFLSANASPAVMQSHVGKGFYYFLAYCLLSLLALQVMPDLQLAELEGVEDSGERSGAEPQAESVPSSPRHPTTLEMLEQEAEKRAQLEKHIAFEDEVESKHEEKAADGQSTRARAVDFAMLRQV